MAQADHDTNELLRRYLYNTISAEEMEELVTAIRTSGEQMPAFENVLLETYESSFTERPALSAEDRMEILNNLLARIQGEERVERRPVHRVHFLKTAWFKYAAAIIIIFGIGAYLWNIQQKEKPLITATKPVPVKNDIAPGRTKATLTLSDGRKVELNTTASETIQDGTLSIKNSNGQLNYSGSLSPAGGSGRAAAEGGSLPAGRQGAEARTATNTMSTPRGGQYQLTLPDGTNVWLNAASSITYPTAFNGNNRTVTITGEAYFEVKKNPSKPFIVKTPKEEITVLGTSFNVNIYPNEPVSKTSLIEGSIHLSSAGGGGLNSEQEVRTGVILQPGQAYQNGKITATNIEQDLAWKNGIFNFSNQDFATSMRQLERWYDIKVVYDGAIPTGKFSGEISRNLNLSDAIELLNGVVARFELQGRELHVLK